MALIKCGECGKEVSSDAATCPSCGKKVAKKHTVRNVLLGAVGLFVLVGVLGSKSRSDAPSSAASAAVAAPIDVSAASLYQAYEQNEVAADEQYKGKILRVAGKVTSIDKTIGDTIVVHISSGQMFRSVMAYPEDSEVSKAAALVKGGPVSVVCVGGGKVMISPVLRKCVIE